MPEKRLAIDQVPFTTGGGGSEVLQSNTIERTAGPDTTGSTTFVPVGPPGSTLISFSLANDSTVFLAAYGSSPETFDTILGIRVDGITDYTGTRCHNAAPTDVGGVTCTLAVPLSSGSHTAEVIYKSGGLAPAYLDSNALSPTRISAAWLDPVYGVGSLTKLETQVANPPPSAFTFAANPAWQVLPGSLISFTIPTDQTVYISASGNGYLHLGGWIDTQIGLRVDGTDYPGTYAMSWSSYGWVPLVAMRAFNLASGPHAVEIVLRSRSPGLLWTGGIYTQTDLPATLTILLTKPEQLYEVESIANPTTIEAGDTGAPGTSDHVSRADHEHPVDTGLVGDIQPTGTANSAGTSTRVPRADHAHRLLLEGQDEGVAVGFRPKINFIGSAVTVADNVPSDRLDVTVTGTAITSTPPTTIQPDDTSTVGTSTEAARADHLHGIVADAAGAIQIGDSAAEGTSTSISRADHKHSLAAPAAPVNVTKAAAAAGTATTPARSDHKHDITTGVAADITDATNAEGTATTLARSDHTHSHGSRSGGTLHSVATTSVAGFMSGADKTKLDGLAPSYVATVQTLDATPTTLATIAITADSSCLIEAHVAAKETSTGTTRAGYVVQALVYRIGTGAATRQGTDNSPFTRESTATMDVTITTSGNDAIVQVTGVAATTINWKTTYRTTEVSG